MSFLPELMEVGILADGLENFVQDDRLGFEQVFAGDLVVVFVPCE